MSLLPQLERDLREAAKRRRRWRLTPRRSAVLAIAVLAVLAVPALAVTGAFNRHRDVISTLGGCGGRATSSAPPVSRLPTAPTLLNMLGSLRRPRSQADALPDGRGVTLLPTPQATRLVRKDRDGTRYFLGPVDNVNYQPPLPRKPGCRVYQFQRDRNKPERAVCLYVFGPGGRGGSCGTASSVAQGHTTQWGGGRGPAGAAHASLTGIAPDGVVAVTVRFHGARRLRLPVVGNVYAVHLSGSAADRLLQSPSAFSQPRILFHYGNGSVRQVEPAPSSTGEKRRARRQQRVVSQRDRNATRTPAVFPPTGVPGTVFTVRARLPYPKQAPRSFLISLRGPEPGSCRRELVFLTSAELQFPGQGSGRVRRRGHLGLLKYGLGAYNVSPGRVWCQGTYHGSVSYAPNGPHRQPRELIGRFSFKVR